MQARQREAVLEALARNQHEHVKIDGNGGHLGGAVTEEDVRAFVGEFKVDQVRYPILFLGEVDDDLKPSYRLTITSALLKGAA
jgi:hypothetical protein